MLSTTETMIPAVCVVTKLFVVLSMSAPPDLRIPAIEACRKSGSEVFGTGKNITYWDFYESGVSVANIQCHQSNSSTAVTNTIYDDLCSGGQCCSPKCLYSLNEVTVTQMCSDHSVHFD